MEGWEELKPEDGLGFRWDLMPSEVLVRAENKICFFWFFLFVF